MHLTRRLFLLQSAAWASSVYAAPLFQRYPFALGVMSGDPSADGFVIWTRLAPDPLNGGGMSPEPVKVNWVVAEDDSLRRIVRRGETVATPELAHTVHVEVAGLRPGRPYWYRFQVEMDESPVGRAITAPATGDMLARMRFAFASCQHWEQGLWTAYEHMLADDPELVVHLGDYIYEGPTNTTRVRQHNSAEIKTLADYRNRHALYKSDPVIQKMHAHCPWLLTWDDHEVDNNYAADVPEDQQPRPEFLERRASAYQAYYEHMPLRLSSLPTGSRMQLYRNVNYGRLVQFSVLDTRQYRSDQPCGDRTIAPCPEVFDPGASILGDAQEQWLKQSLSQSPARWNFIANQVQMTRVDLRPGDEVAVSTDQWSGYEVGRNRMLQFLNERKPSNPIVITGDIHSSWVSDLKLDWKDERSPVVGSEFTGTSISSAGDGVEEQPNTQAWYSENPHLKMYNGRRGYVLVSLDGNQCQADYRTIEYVTKPGAPIRTQSSWVVENVRRGVQKA